MTNSVPPNIPGPGYVTLVDINGNPLISNPNGQALMANSSPVVMASDFIGPTGLNDGGSYVAWNDIANTGKTGASGSGVPPIIPFYSNGATYDAVRTPATVKTATATASGNTAVWTPTSGKKFRLMRLRVDVPANAAISGGGVILDITFQDATTALGIGISVFVPTTAVTTTMGGFTTGWIDIGNGILSATANNVLNINLSATLTTGKVRTSVAGTEE